MKKMGLQTANALYRATIASAAAYAAVKEFDEAAKEYYEEALKLEAGAPPAAYARGNSKYECAMCGKKTRPVSAACESAKRVKLCRHCYLQFYLDSKNEIAIADGATTA